MFTLKLFRSTDTMACRGTSTDSGETSNSCLTRGGGNLRPGLVALMTFSLCLPMTRRVDASTIGSIFADNWSHITSCE